MGIKDSLFTLMGDFVQMNRNPDFRSKSDLSAAGASAETSSSSAAAAATAARRQARRHSLNITVGTEVAPNGNVRQRTFSITPSMQKHLRELNEKAIRKGRRARDSGQDSVSLAAAAGRGGAAAKRASGSSSSSDAESVSNDDDDDEEVEAAGRRYAQRGLRRFSAPVNVDAALEEWDERRKGHGGSEKKHRHHRHHRHRHSSTRHGRRVSITEVVDEEVMVDKNPEDSTSLTSPPTDQVTDAVAHVRRRSESDERRRRSAHRRSARLTLPEIGEDHIPAAADEEELNAADDAVAVTPGAFVRPSARQSYPATPIPEEDGDATEHKCCGGSNAVSSLAVHLRQQHLSATANVIRL